MRDFRILKGEVQFRANQVFMLVGFVSLALFNTGCAGLISASKSAPQSGNPTSPAVAMTAPSSGAVESGSVTISATVTDTVSVAGVQFQLDGTNVGSLLTASPYTYVWDTTKFTNGTHSLRARAKDANGNVGTSPAISVTVQNSTNPTSPTVSITAPGNGAKVSGTVTVSANASDKVAWRAYSFAWMEIMWARQILRHPTCIL